MRSCETQKDTASERFTFCLPCVCNIFLCISNVTAAAINRQIDRCRPSYKAHYRLPFLEFSSDSSSVKEHSIPLLQICPCGYYINSVPVFLVCRTMLIICTLCLPLRQECPHPFQSVRLWEWNSYSLNDRQGAFSSVKNALPGTTATLFFTAFLQK